MSRNYDTFMLSDEPKIFGIPIVSGLPCVAFTLIGMPFGFIYQGFVLGAIISIALHLKFNGQGIRFFLSIVYWMLPKQVSMAFGLRRFPDSANRTYLK